MEDLIFYDTADLDMLSVSTADDEVPQNFLAFSPSALDTMVEPLTDEPSSKPRLAFGVNVDELGEISPTYSDTVDNQLRFPLREIDLCVTVVEDSLIDIHAEARRAPNAEWSLVAQIRFYVGDSNPLSELRVVDADVFAFSSSSPKLRINIRDPNVGRMKLALRYIYWDFQPSPQQFFNPRFYDVSVLLQAGGRTFPVHRGFLEAHNAEEFGRGNNGEYYPRISLEMRRELNHNDLKVGDAMEVLLAFLYPPHKTVQMPFVRPLLIFAHVHKMPQLLRSMEDALIMEPPLNPRLMLEHFQLAERYQLKNLMRACLIRVEGTYEAVAHDMINMNEYTMGLSLPTQQMIADRMCSGWALDCRRLADRIPTKNLNRAIALNDGGVVRENEELLHSFYEVHSDYAFGPRVKQ